MKQLCRDRGLEAEGSKHDAAVRLMGAEDDEAFGRYRRSTFGCPFFSFRRGRVLSVKDFDTGNAATNAAIRDLLTRRLDVLRPYARLRGLNGHGDKLVVVKRLVELGDTAADVPVDDALPPLDDVARFLTGNFSYRELRAQAAIYGVGTTASMSALASRIAAHEAWLEELDWNVPARKKRVAVAMRLRNINVKQYEPTSQGTADASVVARRKSVGAWDKRRLIELLEEERGYVEKEIRAERKNYVVELFVDEESISKGTCRRHPTVSVSLELAKD